MSLRNNFSISDDLLDQLLAGSDDRTVFEMGAMRGSLKRVLTERALNAKLSRQLPRQNSLWQRFALRAQPLVITQSDNFQGQQAGN